MSPRPEATFEWDRGKDLANRVKHGVSYSDEPMGDVHIVADFLPSPDELAFREDTVKVTMGLSRASVDFFKHEAAKHHVSYQRMIRRLLDEYAAKHTG